MTRENWSKVLSRLNLLIIDELGFVPLSPTGAEPLVEVFGSERLSPRAAGPAGTGLLGDGARAEVRGLQREALGGLHRQQGSP